MSRPIVIPSHARYMLVGAEDEKLCIAIGQYLKTTQSIDTGDRERTIIKSFKWPLRQPHHVDRFLSNLSFPPGSLAIILRDMVKTKYPDPLDRVRGSGEIAYRVDCAFGVSKVEKVDGALRFNLDCWKMRDGPREGSITLWAFPIEEWPHYNVMAASVESPPGFRSTIVNEFVYGLESEE